LSALVVGTTGTLGMPLVRTLITKNYEVVGPTHLVD